MDKRRVVVTGLGTVNPIGHNTAETWAAAKAGTCGIGPITLFDASGFKVHLAGEVKDFDPQPVIERRDAKKMARFTQFAVYAAAEALADSGLSVDPDSPEELPAAASSYPAASAACPSLRKSIPAASRKALSASAPSSSP